MSNAVRRTLDYKDFDQLAADLCRLRDRGYARTGQWSLSQACDHLVVTASGSLDGYPKMMFPWLARVTIGKLILRTILRKRKMRTGLKVPKEILPGAARDDAPSVETLLQLVERLRRWQGPYHEHPAFGCLSRDQWTQLVLIHAAHHLSFLVPKD